MLRLAIILAMSATAAAAQTVTAGDGYVIYANLAACQARSQAQCAALGCDGVHTVRWWACVGPLVSGSAGPHVVLNSSYGLDVQPSGPFAATTTNANAANTGLSAAEQTNEAAANAVAPLAANATSQ